jgi:hypothetical protein
LKLRGPIVPPLKMNMRAKSIAKVKMSIGSSEMKVMITKMKKMI